MSFLLSTCEVCMSSATVKCSQCSAVLCSEQCLHEHTSKPVPCIDARRVVNTKKLVWSRAVWLPDKLRKVWIVFAQDQKRSSTLATNVKYSWDYANLKVYLLTPNLNDIEALKKKRNDRRYLDILRAAENEILTAKRIAKFKKKHQLSAEARIVEEADWRQLLQRALTEPARAPQMQMLYPFSLRNQLLFVYQMIERGIVLSPVRTAKQWSEQGMSIAAGERALYALVPDLGPRASREQIEALEDDDPDSTVRRFVYLPRFFAYTQTVQGREEAYDGWVPPDIPTFSARLCLAAFDVNPIEFVEKDYVGVISKEEAYKIIEGWTYGWSQEFDDDDRVYTVRPGSDAPLGTFFHELGHIVLMHTHSTYDYKARRSEAELEAESTALLCMAAVGIDTFSESAPYIQGWWNGLSDDEIYPEPSATRVVNAANKILRSGMQRD